MVEDFYAILGVDPRADRANLEAALQRAQPVWSSGTRNPKTKHRFQSYLDQIPTIRRTILGDPAARAAYDADRLASLQSQRDIKLDELQRWVRLRAAKGGLTPTDRTLLAETTTRLGLSTTDLDRLTALIPAKPDEIAPAEAPEPPPDVLDAVARKQIRVTLDHLRKRDLYDALGLLRDAPAAEVVRRSDEERRRWMQKSQVTAEKTAWLEAVSHAQSHLTNPPGRARYDRTLALEAEERLVEAIAFAVRGLGRLDYGTRSMLVAEGAAEGIDADRAGVLIGRGCRALGVAFDAPSALLNGSIDPPRYLRCRSCSAVTEFAAVAGSGANPATVRPDCPHCGASLRWHCPSCGRDHWVDVARCGCGFLRENVEPVGRLLGEAQRCFRDRDFRAAVDRLRQVQTLVPDHPAARRALKSATRHLAEADAARVTFESARARRHLVAAQAAVRAWAEQTPADDPAVLAAAGEVESGLRSALHAVGRAEAALMAGDLANARDLFDAAIAFAADLPAARQGRLRVPPDPPTRLIARFDRDRVRLRWTPAPSDGLGPVQFRVVRQTGGVPTQSSDGALIATTEQAEAEDTTLRPGEAVAYAVFAARGKAVSPTGATSVLTDVLADVVDLHGEVRSGETNLSWTLPMGAIAVRVLRNPHRPPRDEHDGDLVPALPNGLTDQGLENDRPYHYAIFAVYSDPQAAGERLARGVRLTLVPRPPAEAVPAPTLAPSLDGRVAMTWTNPLRGDVRILRTTRLPAIEPGDHLPGDSLAAWGGDWVDPTTPGRAEDANPPPIGLCFYTPVVFLGGEATVGHPARYSCVADPSDLRAVRAGGAGQGGRVHLRWRWSPQGVESRVVALQGRPPTSADDPAAASFRVFDDEYSRLGYFAITLPTGTEPGTGAGTGPWHLAVFAVAMVGGEEVVSPGLDPSARTALPGPNPEVTVAYTWRRPGLVSRHWSLTFHTDPTGSPIPPTALVTHPRTVPLSADDGAIVARFPAATDGATFTVPSLPDLTRGRARIFADPTADPADLPPIRFRHPDATTRV